MTKMKTYFIPKGFHYSNFIPSIRRIDGDFMLDNWVSFTESCKYQIGEKSCVNKLFGFCFGGLCGVHKDSARIGWVWSEEKQKIVLLAYLYQGGKLHKEELCDVLISEEHNLRIYVEKVFPNMYVNGKLTTNYCVNFIVDGSTICYFYVASDKKYFTTLGPYFGGKSRAPHCIAIKNKASLTKVYKYNKNRVL